MLSHSEPPHFQIFVANARNIRTGPVVGNISQNIDENDDGEGDLDNLSYNRS